MKSCVSKTVMFRWFEFIKANKDKFQKNQINIFYNQFFNASDFKSEHLNLFEYFTSTLPADKLPLKKILYNLQEKKELALVFSKYEYNLNKVLIILINLIDSNKDDTRLQPIYSFVKRLENLGVRLKRLSLLIKKAFEISKANGSYYGQIDLLCGIYLLDKNQLNVEYTRALYDKIKSKLSLFLYLFLTW